MASGDGVQRVRFYISEDDVYEGRPLYLTILELLQREGATGATALHGIAGFGPGQGIPGTTRQSAGHIPVVVEWIDRAEFIARVLPLLAELLPSTMITLDDVRVYRAMLRSHGVFSSGQQVGDIMQSAIQTLAGSASLGKAVALMLAHTQATLPVVDDQHKLIGVVTETDIARRTGLRVPLRVIPMLNKEEGNELIGPVAARLVSDVMNVELRSVQVQSFIPQALTLMIEWNYDQLPVLDRQDKLAGLLNWTDVLTAVLDHTAASEHTHDNEQQPTPVSLVMQQAVPQVTLNQTLATGLHHILKAADHYVVVVDNDNRVQGTIELASVFRHITSHAERMPLLDALQTGTAPEPTALPGNHRTLAEVLEREITTITPRETIIDAIRRLIERRVERMPVVDEEGRLLGLIARGGLLRALTQESR